MLSSISKVRTVTSAENNLVKYDIKTWNRKAVIYLDDNSKTLFDISTIGTVQFNGIIYLFSNMWIILTLSAFNMFCYTGICKFSPQETKLQEMQERMDILHIYGYTESTGWLERSLWSNRHGYMVCKNQGEIASIFNNLVFER